MADDDRKHWPGVSDGIIDSGIAKRGPIPTDTIGSSDVPDFGGYTAMDDRSALLMGTQRYATFEEMLRDTSIVAAGVRSFLNLIANADWTVNPAEGMEQDAQANDIADHAYAMLHDMDATWATVVRKTAMYRFYGFAVLEWTAKKNSDGTIGLADVSNRPQKSIVRWPKDPNGKVVGVVQAKSAGEVTIPRSKLVYAVDDTLTDSPEGMGLFRHLVTTNERLKLYLDLEKMGYETDLRGMPVVRAPLGELHNDVVKAAAEGEPAKARASTNRNLKLAPLRKWLNARMGRKSIGVELPSDVYTTTTTDGKATPSNVYKWAVELLQGDSTSFEEIATAIDRFIHELARILGVEHLLLGAQGGGSLALAQSKIGTFYLTITATLLDLVQIFQRDLLKPMGALNGWPDEKMPLISVGEVHEQDITDVTTALMQMANAGAVLAPDDPAIGEVRDMLGLSRPDPNAEVEDAALGNPRDPADPDKPMLKPEQSVAKRRIKSPPRMRRMRNRKAC